jgi:hypothetical protein
MRKWIKRIAIVFIVIIIVFFLVLHWMFKEAFGPKHRTVKIKLDEQQTLIGSETYTADMAAVFYEVDFELQEKNSGIYKLGKTIFFNAHWDKNIKVYELADWIVLPVSDGDCSKLLLTNRITHQHIDTAFSPQSLRDDEVWMSRYADIPSTVYHRCSKLDNISKDRFFVSYEYQLGNYPLSKFYNQTIEYQFDTAIGAFKNVHIFERHENKNHN